MSQAARRNFRHMLNGRIEATIGGDALTVAIKHESGEDPSPENQVFGIFRLEDDSYETVPIESALSFTIGPGAGFSQGNPYRVWVALIYDVSPANVRVALYNACAPTSQHNVNIVPFGEAFGMADTVDQSGVSLFAQFITDAELFSRPYTIIGFMDWYEGQDDALTWDVAPSRVTHYRPGMPVPGDVVNESISQANAYSEYVGYIEWYASLGAAPLKTDGVAFGGINYDAKYPCNVLDYDLDYELLCTAAGPISFAIFSGNGVHPDVSPDIIDSFCPQINQAYAPAPDVPFSLRSRHRFAMSDQTLWIRPRIGFSGYPSPAETIKTHLKDALTNTLFNTKKFNRIYLREIMV